MTDVLPATRQAAIERLPPVRTAPGTHPIPPPGSSAQAEDRGRKVRVAQVVTRCIAGAGGMAVRGALALDPQRFEVTVLAGSGGPLLDQVSGAGHQVVEVDHLIPPLSPLSDALALRELVRHLRAGQFDIVHTHSAKAGTLGRLAARQAGVPGIVHTFHGFPFHDFQSRTRRLTYQAIERRLGSITDLFLAVGGAVAADAVKLGIAQPDQIRAIESIVDAGIPLSTPDLRREARERLGIGPDVAVVGTVGRLDDQKAPLDAVAALSAMSRRDAVWIWVGSGPLEGEVRRALLERGLGQRFRLLGERSDVAQILPAFDVFALGSLYEGLPCAVVEAMTAGIPVVASAVNAVPEVVVPGQTGLLVPPHRPRVLARAVDHLLNHPEEAAALAAEAAGRVSRDHAFEPEALGRDLTRAYLDVLGDRAPTGTRTG